MTDPRLSRGLVLDADAGPARRDGPGRVLAGRRCSERALKRVFPQLDGKPAFSLEGLPRVVIVGAGFGGLDVRGQARQRAGEESR